MIKIVSDYKDEITKIKQERAQVYSGDLALFVKNLVNDVRQRKDQALFEYTKKYDGVELNADTIAVTDHEIEEAYSKVSQAQIDALRKAIDNLYAYQSKMLKSALKGAYLNKRGYMVRAVERAGIYVPGGKAAYPSSVVMCAIPAVVAGVREIYMVTPSKGELNPLTIVAANECGIDKIFKVGGAQAIAALAYGTESVPKVDVIAGPGNIYVTLAKKEVFGEVGIDMLAGPSEIFIIADKTANPKYLAADMLSQAEHDEMAASYLATDSMELAQEVQKEIEKQVKELERSKIATASIEKNGRIFVTENLLNAVMISNEIAPEHLEIMTARPKSFLPYISNAGAVFLGEYSPEPLGDYFAGPDHVLPTSGSARFFSALSVDTFIKKISLINYSKAQLYKAHNDIMTLSASEGLTAHTNSIKIRFSEDK